MDGKIKRKIEADGSVRLHEAVSDSVYMRGEGLEARTLTEFAKPHRISLLHMSDNHNSTVGIGVMSALLATANNDDVLGINTGDVEGYSSVSTTLEASLSAMATHNAGHATRPILLVKGNHDARDTTSGTDANRESTATGYITRVNGNAVTYGKVGSTNKGYWYKDVTHNGVKLRLIALDEYQYSVALPENGSNDSNRYSKVYSTDQVEWLEAVLKSTPSDAYIIMAHHQPLYPEHPTDVLNDFIHHGINGTQIDSNHTYTNTLFTYLEGNIDLPARIIDAYIHKKELNFTCVNGKAGTTLTVDVDFKGIEPAKFACHINGHVHGDYCEYHPDYPEQLCLTIGTDSPTISTWYDDLSRSESGEGHVINRVTIDADRNVVRLQRIGADTLKTQSWVYQDGSARKAIEFPIKPVAVEPTPADALATYCPIIEDTRTSVVGAITADAPFASLVDGQRIVLRLAYATVNNSTLSLNGGTAYDVYGTWVSQAPSKNISGIAAGSLIPLIFEASNNRWLMMGNKDTNTTYYSMSQAEIDAGSVTSSRVITPKILCDNFQKLTAIVTMPSGAIAPTGGYDANKMYNFGKVSAVVFSSFNTASEIANSVNLYMFTFQVASGGTTLSLNANTMYPNGEDANSLEGLLSTEDRVFEITIRRIVVTENNEDVSYYLMSYLYFD